MNKLKNFIRFLRFFTCLPISSILSIIIIGAIFKESKNHEFHLRELIGSFVWFTSVNLIVKNPLIGIGPSVFPYLYKSIKDAFAGHPHNLFLELSLSYGLIVSIIIFTTIIFLLYKFLTMRLHLYLQYN